MMEFEDLYSLQLANGNYNDIVHIVKQKLLFFLTDGYSGGQMIRQGGRHF